MNIGISRFTLNTFLLYLLKTTLQSIFFSDYIISIRYRTFAREAIRVNFLASRAGAIIATLCIGASLFTLRSPNITLINICRITAGLVDVYFKMSAFSLFHDLHLWYCFNTFAHLAVWWGYRLETVFTFTCVIVISIVLAFRVCLVARLTCTWV